MNAQSKTQTQAARQSPAEQAEIGMRRKFYIDPEVQFPLIAMLIGLVTVEGVLIAWGFYKAIMVAQEWKRASQAWDFFWILFLTVVPTVALNFCFGVYFSNKIAGPLYRLRQAMAEISRGNLEVDINLRKGDFLQSCGVECNKMIQTLRHLLYRDYQYAAEVNKLLTECEEWLTNQKGVGAEDGAKLRKLINEGKNRLSIVNAHFMKGKRERP